MAKNPLEALVVDSSASKERNLEDLAKLLSPYVVLNKETKTAEFLPAFHDLKNQEKILILLAGMRACKELFDTEETLSMSDILKRNIMPDGSVKSSLNALTSSGEIKSDKGKYSLPIYRISSLVGRMLQAPKTK